MTVMRDALRRSAVVRLIPSRHRLGMLAVCLGAFASPADAFQQSPQLDAVVKEGKLPPVEKRLPENPLVVQPVEKIGKYGGIWRSGLRGGNDGAWIARTVAYEGLVRYDRDWQKIVPNIAESWEVNADATVYTFRLRKGLKWSDGSPFTPEDVAFAVELIGDPKYPTNVTGWMRDKSNPVTVEIVDDRTFRLTFKKPAGLLMDQLATINGINATMFSKAYCSQFHPKYNPDADKLAKDRGFQDWVLMMLDRCSFGTETKRWMNGEAPQMTAWVLKEPIRGNATRVVFERNAYYFKVDPAGNQLPYIDTLNMRVSESLEELTLMALNGEIDFQDRHINTIVNKPIFHDNQKKGQYHFIEDVLSNSNTMVIQLNFNHADPVMRELINKREFRIGLSYAIDRREIIDIVFTGQGQPYQVAPRPETPFYDEDMGKQYTAFDLKLAGEHFAKAGLTKKNADGIFLRADGKPLTFAIDVIAAFRPEWIDMLELIQVQLRKAGVDIRINNIDRSLFYNKRPNNDFDAQVWQGDGGLDVLAEPRYYFPHGPESVWAFRWQSWFNGTNPQIAEEPADWAKRQMELYRQIGATADPENQAALMKEILKITKEQFPVIGISLPPSGYGIVKNNLKNVAPVMKHAWLFPTPGPYDPSQWFFE
jgi:peptide/nickel transport system substrate-binding protein